MFASLQSHVILKEGVNQGAPILVGEFNNVVWVRVEGKGNFQNSPELKEFAIRMIDRGRTAMVVDLEECPAMDSTFMGTLTGIAIRLKAVCFGKLDILNANPRNQQLLESLGLDQIFYVDVDRRAWIEERELVKHNLLRPEPGRALGKRDHAEFVLEAHESLCKANDDNVRRFKDVIDFLKHDTEKQSS